MFSRLKNAVEVLRSPTEQVHPLARGVSTVPTTEEIEEQRAAKKRSQNPAVTLIEIGLVCYIAAYGVFPLFSRFFKADTTATLGATLTAFLMTYILSSLEERLHGALGAIVRLDFLDPFVGRHLKRAIQVLSNKDDEGDTLAS